MKKKSQLAKVQKKVVKSFDKQNIISEKQYKKAFEDLSKEYKELKAKFENAAKETEKRLDKIVLDLKEHLKIAQQNYLDIQALTYELDKTKFKYNKAKEFINQLIEEQIATNEN